ncbi:MAG: phage portal protein [Planctomycetes bacterium]|nr:phage portal protein [Planctomycetota bacterium]MCH8120446.1 phage portal protein [Planctomycetota bacterium]
MGFELDIFQDEQLEAEYIEWLVDEQSVDVRGHFEKLWEYYANPRMEIHGTGACERKINESGRCYVQAQEYGLPVRITGLVHSGQVGVFGARSAREVQRKEVVIENDIAWRINAAVDFLFGKPISFVSKSPDGQKSTEIGAILKALFAANGAIGFFQDMAVLGSVYGFVDCFVRPGEEIIERISSSSQTLSRCSRKAGPLEDVLQLTQTIGLELIEAPRALPVLDENDYKKTKYYVQHFYQKKNSLSKNVSRGSWLVSRFFGHGSRSTGHGVREVVEVTEITSASAYQRYENKQLVAETQLPWGFLPVVHIQNIAQPYYYEGLSDVEPLIPLQDELNTRLSDRASRITFQSFKMYLGKGIEGFEDKPISPGMMWYTDNPEATIEEFGGDAATPSESTHIAEIREALDKVSGVTPVVAGVLKNKLGNLTSAVALRLTLMGMLSRNERKRFTYSDGLKRICRMVLAILDTANIYKSSEVDREVDIVFPSPLPENMMEKLKEAQIKKELGVPTEQVLRELGYESS